MRGSTCPGYRQYVHWIRYVNRGRLKRAAQKLQLSIPAHSQGGFRGNFSPSESVGPRSHRDSFTRVKMTRIELSRADKHVHFSVLIFTKPRLPETLFSFE